MALTRVAAYKYAKQRLVNMHTHFRWCDATIEVSPMHTEEAHPDVAALEDHGDGARLPDGLVEAVNLPLHQIHEGCALAADAAAAGQDGQGAACKQPLSLSQTQHPQQHIAADSNPGKEEPDPVYSSSSSSTP